MKWLVLLLLVPLATAGTQDDPELTDPENDVRFYPTGEGPYPLADWTKAWISEDETALYLHLEVRAHSEIPSDVPNGWDNPRYIIGVHVNGIAEDSCLGYWGDFNLDAWWTPNGYSGHLRVYDPYDGDGCGGTDYDGLPVSVEDDVVTFAVPWDAVPGLVAANDVLGLAETRASASAAWPTRMRDVAEDLPSRTYAVTMAPGRLNSTGNATSGEDVGDAPDPGADKKSPMPPATGLLAIAVAAWSTARRPPKA